MCHASNERGFTIVEALVAVVILGVTITALLAVFNAGIGMQHLADMAARASYLANDGLEEMRARFNAGNFDAIVEPAPNPMEVSPGFQRRIDVTSTGTSPNRMWTIRSTVTYSAGGVQRSVSYQTVLAEP